MATATSLVAQKRETSEWAFMAQRKEYNLYLSPDRDIVEPDGSRRRVYGDRVWFGPAGGFEPYEFRTSDPDLAERLRTHTACMVEGDYKEIPVVVPPPPADTEMAQVMQLVADRDAQTLIEMYAEEQLNWSRPALLDAISKALVALEAQGVEVEEVPVRPNGSAVEATGAAAPAPEPGVRVGPPPVDDAIPVDDLDQPTGAADRAFYQS